MSSDTTTASFSDNDLLKLFQIDKKDVEHVEVHHKPDGVYVSIRMNVEPHICPVCGASTSKIRGYYHKKLNHSVLKNVPCYIDYEARRYECRRCHKTFYEHNPFAMKNSRISLTTVYNILNDLKNPKESFTNVAKRHNVSITTVISIFDHHVHISRASLPEYLCLDEVYAFRSHKSNYVCVMLDYSSQNIVDLLPSRQKYDLINYFESIPREERCKVKIVSFDLWETYRIVVNLLFPNALCAADRFHVIQELNRRLDKVRIAAMNQCYSLKKKDKKTATFDDILKIEDAEKHYYVFKKFHWLLFKNDNSIFDPNAEKKYNTVLKGYYNYDDLLRYMLDSDKELEEAYNLKDSLINFYQKANYTNAKAKLEDIIIDFRSSHVKEMSSFANTLSRWKKEIINSFIIVAEREVPGQNKVTQLKINNGIIENRNKTIKDLKHCSNGYLNWERFRNRVLYSLNKDATFYLYPKFAKKGDSYE